MASCSSAAPTVSSLPTATISALLSHIFTEKLSRDNFSLWQAQVMPAIRGAQLLDILEGKVEASSILIAGEDSADKTKTIQVANPDHAT